MHLPNANMGRTMTARKGGSVKIRRRWERREKKTGECPSVDAICQTSVQLLLIPGACTNTMWQRQLRTRPGRKGFSPFILLTHLDGCCRFHWSWPSWNLWLFICIYINEIKQCSFLRKYKKRPDFFLLKVPICCCWDCTLQCASKLLVKQL